MHLNFQCYRMKIQNVFYEEDQKYFCLKYLMFSVYYTLKGLCKWHSYYWKKICIKKRKAKESKKKTGVLNKYRENGSPNNQARYSVEISSLKNRRKSSSTQICFISEKQSTGFDYYSNVPQIQKSLYTQNSY